MSSIPPDSFTMSGLYYYPKYFDTVSDQSVVHILYNLTLELESCMQPSQTDEQAEYMTMHVIPQLFRFMHKIRRIMTLRGIISPIKTE